MARDIERRVAVARMMAEHDDEPAAAVLLDLLDRDSMLSPEVALELVPIVWDLCAAPMSVLSVDAWVRLFERAGYTHDREVAPRPTEPMRLYRGSDRGGELGMCWSSNLDVARWLAIRRHRGRVWSAVVEPWRMLAFVAPVYEDQYVVDTRGLETELLEGPEVVAAIDPNELVARLDALVEIGPADGDVR